MVEAQREPTGRSIRSSFIEKDGYFYGRGSGDDKFMAAAFVANIIRYKQEGFRPDRDIILALDTDEETVDRKRVGIQWLIKNHRDLIDAEFALNEGGGVGLKGGKPIRNSVQTSEKVTFSYYARSHQSRAATRSVPSRDNAIYHLAEGLARLAQIRISRRPQRHHAASLEARRRASRSRKSQPTSARSLVRDPGPGRTRAPLRKPVYNAQLRTTCVATMLEGGHAFNALPQSARATVNCRIMPGEKVDDIEATLNARARGRPDRGDADRTSRC